jgi:hypothetical protein
MMSWTHNICLSCWKKREPDRKPVRVIFGDERCCFCGNLNNDGIFIREDPKKLNCHCDENKALAIRDELPPPELVLGAAQTYSKALMELVSKKKKPIIINNETYLEYEDWQTMGQFYGYSVKTGDAISIEIDGIKGAKAKAELVDKYGQVVGGAEAYCMKDEPNWRNKPWFQLASMAQTRAGAKAFRNRLAWVVVLAGFKPTPAEEMDGVHSEEQGSPPILTINQVTVKSGEKDGKSWELYTVHADNGEGYTTFDKKVAELAKKFKENHTKCFINYKDTPKGKNIIDIQEYKERDEEPPE